jgi:hypothetical protein
MIKTILTYIAILIGVIIISKTSACKKADFACTQEVYINDILTKNPPAQFQLNGDKCNVEGTAKYITPNGDLVTIITTCK